MPLNTKREPCPACGCPGEKYDGHVCEEYEARSAALGQGYTVVTLRFEHDNEGLAKLDRLLGYVERRLQIKASVEQYIDKAVFDAIREIGSSDAS